MNEDLFKVIIEVFKNSAEITTKLMKENAEMRETIHQQQETIGRLINRIGGRKHG